MIFESHAHYDDEQFDEDRDTLLQALPQHNVGAIVNVGSSLESSEASIALAEAYDYVYASVGVHPDEVGDLTQESVAALRTLAMHPKVVAIGEIGLDYYRKEEEGTDYKDVQKQWFQQQLELAALLRKPVIVHSREAAEDTLHILEYFYAKHPEIYNPGVIHCFSYSPEIAAAYTNMGFYIGVGGVVTFRNAKKLVETVKYTPIDRILVETDSPYLAPEPNRGKRNDSSNIRYVIEKIAQIKEMTPEDVERQTEINARNMYGI